MIFKQIVRLFERGSVCVAGQRGCGKDMLMGNVCARRRSQYVSNNNYTGDDKYIPLDVTKLNCGGNSWRNLLKGYVKHYVYPYPERCDIYISDCGVYFPAQYCNEINRDYPDLGTFLALSRHLGDVNVHVNSQNFARVHLLLREQSDTYIYCNKCIYVPFLRLVVQRVTIYEMAESFQRRIRPCRVRIPTFNAEAKMSAQLYLDNYVNTYGEVKRRWLVYFNRAHYDTRHFKKMFEEGER